MRRKNTIFALPLAMIFFIFLLILLLVLSILISSVFRALGFSPLTTITIFFFSLFGSAVNIPIYSKKIRKTVEKTPSAFLDSFLYPERVNEYRVKETIIAVNLGGAIIPLIISIYLVYSHPYLWLQFLIGIFIVSSASYRFSRVVPMIGISLPIFIPPILAALIAIILPGSPNTVLAFVSGVCGVLIGADLLNLDKICELRSRTMSIGGAGTFDGIFLTGIVAVLIAAI